MNKWINYRSSLHIEYYSFNLQSLHSAIMLSFTYVFNHFVISFYRLDVSQFKVKIFCQDTKYTKNSEKVLEITNFPTNKKTLGGKHVLHKSEFNSSFWNAVVKIYLFAIFCLENKHEAYSPTNFPSP